MASFLGNVDICNHIVIINHTNTNNRVFIIKEENYKFLPLRQILIQFATSPEKEDT